MDTVIWKIMQNKRILLIVLEASAKDEWESRQDLMESLSKRTTVLIIITDKYGDENSHATSKWIHGSSVQMKDVTQEKNGGCYLRDTDACKGH